MATDDPVSKVGEGSEAGLASRPSQVSNFPIAGTNATHSSAGPVAEFLKLRHYVREVRGRLLDKQA